MASEDLVSGLLLSGMQTAEVDEVAEGYRSRGLELVETTMEDGWALVHLVPGKS